MLRVGGHSEKMDQPPAYFDKLRGAKALMSKYEAILYKLETLSAAERSEALRDAARLFREAQRIMDTARQLQGAELKLA